MARKYFTQKIWSHVPTAGKLGIQNILKKGRFPSGQKLTKMEKENARKVLARRRK